MNSNDELFREVFKILHRDLNPKDKSPRERHPPSSSSSLSSLSIAPAPTSHKFVVQKKILEMKYKEEQTLLAQLQKRLAQSVNQTDEMLSASRLACKIRLQHQKRTANKRLQELVFEVLGEYRKALLRAQRRETYLHNYSRVQLALSTWNYRWQRFLYFLEMELSKKACLMRVGSPMRQRPGQTMRRNALNSTSIQLTPQRHNDELQYLTKLLQHRLGLVSEESFQLMTAVRFRRPTGVRAAPTSALILRLHNTFDDLQNTLDALAAWLADSLYLPAVSATSSVPSTCTTDGVLPTVVAHALLSNDCIDWLHPTSSVPHLCDELTRRQQEQNSSPTQNRELEAEEECSQVLFFQSLYMQHSSSLFNSRVYFCLEERQLLQEVCQLNTTNANGSKLVESDVARGILSSLQNCYVMNRPPSSASLDALQNLRALLNSSCLQVAEHLRSHRTSAVSTRDRSFQEDSEDNERKPKSTSSTSNRHLMTHWPDVITATFSVPLDTSTSVLNHNSSSNIGNAPNNNSIKPLTVTLHFAPATILNLLESQPTSTTINQNAAEVSPLQLFCVAVLPLPAKNSVLSYSSDAASVDGLTGTNTSWSQQSKSDRNSSVSNSPYVLCLVALQQTLVTRMYRNYFPSSSNASTSGSRSNDAQSQAQYWGALQLLPDHSRVRYLFTPSSSNSSGSSSSTGVNGNNKRLQHWYALLADDNAFAVTSDTATASVAEDNGSSNKKATASCVYLVQLYALPTNSSNSSNSSNGNNRKVDEEAEDGLQLFPPVSLFPKNLHYNASKSASTTSGIDGVHFTHRPVVSGELSAGLGGQFAQDERWFRGCVREEQRRHCRQPLVIRPKHSSNSFNSRGAAQDIVPVNSIVADHLQLQGNANSTTNSKREWEQAVLSSLCFWRACLCLSVASSPSSAASQVPLCRYHSELRMSLDYHLPNANSNNSSNAAASSNSESAKYLPKKPPVIPATPSHLTQGNSNPSNMNSIAVLQELQAWQSKRDLQLLRAASTLLQELWDGRLKQTVKLFAKKVAVDMRQRAVMEAALQQMKRLLLSYKPVEPNAMTVAGSGSSGKQHGKQVSSKSVAGSINTTNSSSNTSNNFGSSNSSTGADVRTLQRLSQLVLPATPSWALLRQNPTINLKLQQQHKANSPGDSPMTNASNQQQPLGTSIGAVSAQQQQALLFLLRIHEIETAVSQEIQYFVQELNVFPAVEIAQMRRDIRSFKDLQEQVLSNNNNNNNNAEDVQDPQYLLLTVLSEEVKLCERKWGLLKQRKLAEEEHRQQLWRRAQRQRQLEEAQMKDPANFNFHTNSNSSSSKHTRF